MLGEEVVNKYRNDAQGLAEYFSDEYFAKHKRVFPINPFQVLADLNIKFVFKNFKKLEGLYLPSTEESPVELVAINANKPITRQRFSAAHELCHSLKDSNSSSLVCKINSKDFIEQYAEAFAAAFLMPKDELQKQIDFRCKPNEKLTLDDVLIISEYFGTSFQACFYRIRKLYPYLLSYRTKDKLIEYQPDVKRKEFGLSYAKLYFDLFDAWTDINNFNHSEHGKLVFKNNYIFNDERIENEDVALEAVAEIIEDIVSKKQQSYYCSETYDKYCNIAGHSEMFDYIAECAKCDDFTGFKLMNFNKKLYSCFQHPEFGGKTRQSNPYVTGAKFETVDYTEIGNELYKIDCRVKELEKNYNKLKPSELIREIANIHHRITVIHPFSDGNGRTSRGFMNSMLMRYGLIPFFVEIKDKENYLDALGLADKNGNIDELCLFIMKNMINAFVTLNL